MLAPRKSIPAAFRATDNAAYPNAGGTPTHSQLGVRLTQNSRFTLAHERRSWAFGWEVTGSPWALPVVDYSLGTDLRAWPLEITPGCRQIEWQIIADVAAGADWQAVAYTLGEHSPQPWSPVLWEGALAVTLGAGLGETAYGGIYCAVRPGWQWCGVALKQAVHADAAPGRGQVLQRSYGWVQGVAAIDKAPPMGAGALFMLRLTDGFAVGAAPLTGWHQVRRWYTTAIVSDTVDVWPHFTDRELAQQPATTVLGWEIWNTGDLTPYSLAVAETVPTEIVP